MWNKLKCFIGWHKWEQTRPVGILDGFPPWHIPYEPPKRKCLCCGKHQRWLPGYGGSEWGCWITAKEQP